MLSSKFALGVALTTTANFDGLWGTPLCSASLVRRPMLTQCATSLTLFAAGDVVAQQLIEKKGFDKHDVSFRAAGYPPMLSDCVSQFARTARLGFYGGRKHYSKMSEAL